MRPFVFPTLAVGLLALILVGFVLMVPLGAIEHWVYRLTIGPQQSVFLPPHTTLAQTFSAPADTFTALSLFSEQPQLPSRAVRLTLFDKENKIVTQNFGHTTAYHTEKLKLNFLVHARVQRGQQYRLEIENQGEEILSFIAVENEAYPNGQLTVDTNERPETDLALAVTSPTGLPAAVKLGTLAGIAFLLGVLLINFLPRQPAWYRWVAAAVLCMLITPLALGGFVFSQPFWGISDWDYYFSLHHIWRESLLTHYQIPFWNPYTCGGTAALADPEFSVFTPSFLLFELPFGVPLGLRLAALFSVATGSVGMLLLARRLGLSVTAGLLAVLVAFFGSVNILEIVEGHPNIFASMWIPWIFWAWLGAYRKTATPLWCGLFLALTFLQGGIYLLLYTLLAFLVLPLLVGSPWRAIATTVKASLWAAGFCAFKFLPVVFWLREFPDQGYAGSQFTFTSLVDILFGRHLHGAQVIPNQSAGWHEYGAYIGYFVFGLALLGSSLFTKSRLVRGLVIAAVMAMLLSSMGPALEPIFDASPWLPRSMIARVIFFAVLPLALLAGFGLDTLQRKLRWGQIAAVVLIGLVAADLMSLSYQLSTQAFVIPSIHNVRTPAPSPLAFTGKVSTYALPNGGVYTRAYEAVLAGYGTLNYCSVLGPQSSINIIEGEVDPSFVTIDPTQGSLQLLSWSPNQFTVNVVAKEPTKVRVNTNYASGWRVNKEPATEIGNRVGVRVEPGNHTLVFSYATRGFVLGVLVTAGTVVGAIVYLRRRTASLTQPTTSRSR